ncbi:MAG: ABC transporter ATP-binding protein, partial [Oleispira sp.]|nr:ABC transporter ATP-binding protein [Oleispira sp.]
MSLTIRNASYGHKPNQPLFNGIEFSLNTGQIMAVLGPNGAGKTTLLNCITGMMAWQSGETLIHNKPLSAYGDQELWRHIGYVPQARANAFAYTVLDMVLLGRSAHLTTFASPDQDDVAIARRVLSRLEIGYLENAYCNAISGGELQLVFIARALVGQPNILFLDEPESHLDFKKQLIILDIIENLAHEDKIICVMNTHFPNHALRIADYVLLLGSDGTHRFGSTEDVLTEDSIRSFFGVNARINTIDAEGQQLRSIYPISLDRTTPSKPSFDR